MNPVACSRCLRWYDPDHWTSTQHKDRSMTCNSCRSKRIVKLTREEQLEQLRVGETNRQDSGNVHSTSLAASIPSNLTSSPVLNPHLISGGLYLFNSHLNIKIYGQHQNIRAQSPVLGGT
ncbi:hypothetical protein EV426DRAFT_572955 [Tirmania nivea]|nr:hypothetical protein EV426DRAFT_572955 [Tirmania nivea]